MANAEHVTARQQAILTAIVETISRRANRLGRGRLPGCSVARG